MAKSNNDQSSDGGGNSGKRFYGISLVKNTFKAPTEGLQHVIFEYISSNNNKNVCMENVKKLIHHIAVSGAIRYDALTVEYAVRTLTAPEFVVPENHEKDYEGGYNEL